MKYYAHVDGLRTLAVVPVVLYHVGLTAIPGGFVGVDVFFVISGYLITGVLMGDLRADRFSIARFYQRRIQRLLPALFVVLLAVWLVSALLYFPVELAPVGWQLLATATFTANFYFRSQTGYFTEAADTQPLLHTWSLAVEEQFYIFFPILLYFLYRYARKHIASALIGLSVLSFVGCVFLTYVAESTAFYMLPTRAWELGIGAILSVLGARQIPGRWAGGVRFAGVALIVIPMLTYTTESPAFPGWAAALPSVGAALLIGWGGDGIVGKVLALRPVVYIGRVSYSMYLWHWPLIVFYKHATDPTLSAWEMAGLSVASFVLASLSTELVERPFRTKKARAIRPRPVILVGTATLVVLGTLGAIQIRTPISLINAPESVFATAQAIKYRDTDDFTRQFRPGSCFLREDGEVYNAEKCATLATDRPNILLIGDSHAAQNWLTFSEMFPDANVMQATASACRPLLDGPADSKCKELRDWALKELIPEGNIDAAILDGRWESGDMESLEETIAYLKNYVPRIAVLGPTVEYEGDLPMLLARSEARGDKFDFDTLRIPGRDDVDAAMKEVVEAAGAEYISLLSTECSEDGTCTLYAPDGMPLQFDYGHLTLSGSRFVLQTHEDQLRALVP